MTGNSIRGYGELEREPRTTDHIYKGRAALEAYTVAPVGGGNSVDVLLNGDQIFPAHSSAVDVRRRPGAGRRVG